MSDTKVFERADLLMFFGEDPETCAPIGTFNSIRKEGQGDLFALARRTHFVRATTQVMFCEKRRFAVVEQNVHVSDAGRYVLPENHPYRDDSLPRLTLLRGHVCHNSADLSREVVRIADEWREEMRRHVPDGLIDTTKAPADQQTFASVVMSEMVEQINAGALNSDGVTVTAEATPARNGKGRR